MGIEENGKKFIEWQKNNPYKELERTEKIRKAHLGRKFSVEHRKKLSEVKKKLFAEGKIKPTKSNIGIKWKDWVKKKGKCNSCGKRGRIETHHIDFNHHNRKKTNLIDLCRSCHQSIHKTEAWKKIKKDVKVGADLKFKKGWSSGLDMRTDKSSFETLIQEVEG